MQLLLILGIVFAIGAVGFALQNEVAVTVVLGFWRYDSSLAVVLLVALCLGALIAALVSTPGVIRGQWAGARLRRQAASLEKDKAALELRLRELEAQAPQGSPAPAAPGAAPHAGLKPLMMAQEDANGNDAFGGQSLILK
ncbi:MAG: LapA family protein [Burkholderiales bacterium]|nr:LapA family protein [Burkholderiales bacterium]